jgi:hypothetical protein
MEHRDDGLMVDFGGSELTDSGQRQGNRTIVYDAKQERELQTLSQETRLMHAMNEIREYTPKSMNKYDREMFNVMCEKIFAKHGITPDIYASQFGHLGTPQNLRR